MDARTAITTAGLEMLTPGTPVTVVGSREGYGVVVGPADRPRWLSTTAGKFRTFCSLDRVTAVLRACGITRYAVDVTGGTPQ